MEEATAKRKHPRVAVELPASLSVLIPEETFQPFVHEAIVCDLSERGALVKVRVHPQLQPQLIQNTCYCRLKIQGVPELPDKIIGVAVWIKPETMHGVTIHKMGLYFDHCPDETTAKLRKFVATLAVAEGVLPEVAEYPQ